MSVWNEAQAVLEKNPQANIWDEAEDNASIESQRALRTAELLNDPDRKIEDYVAPSERKRFSDFFDLSENPQAERRAFVEKDMISISTGMPQEVVDRMYDDLKKTGFVDELKDQWSGKQLISKVPITGAISSVAVMIGAMQSAKRLNSDFDYSKPITVEQQQRQADRGIWSLSPRVFQEFFHNKEADIQLVEDYVERITRDRTFGGKVAAGVSMLPTWMVEFALTGGVASFGKEATKKGMVKLMQNYAKTKVGANALRLAGWTGGAITRTTLGLPAQVVKGATERQLQVTLGMKQEEGWATSFAKAWGDVVIESASEEAGVAITGFGGKLLNKTKLGAKLVKGLSTAWTSITGGTASQFNKLLAKGGYSNILGEIGEERLGTILRAITDIDDFGAGEDANMMERLKAGLEQDIAGLPVEVVVLSIPTGGQAIVNRFIGGKPVDKAIEPPPATPVAEPAPEGVVAPSPPPTGAKPVKPTVEPPKVTKAQEGVQEVGGSFVGGVHDVVTNLDTDVEMLDLQLDNLQGKLDKGRQITDNDLAQTELFKSGMGGFKAIREEFQKNPQGAINHVRGALAQPPTAKPITEKPKPVRPTKEQAIIDARKFLDQVKAHEALVKGELGKVDVELIEFEIEKEPSAGLTPQWYEQNREVYKKGVLKKAGDFAKESWRLTEKVITPISTRLFNINPKLFQVTRRHVFNVLTRTTEQIRTTETFLKSVKKLSKEARIELDLAFKNSDGPKIQEMLSKHNLNKEFKNIRKILDDLFDAGKKVGLNIDYRRNYMPRMIKDPKGFLDFVRGTDDWPIIEEAIKRQERTKNRQLTEEERAVIANTMLRGYRTSALTIAPPGSTKKRTVPVVDAKLNQFYMNFSDSLVAYIQAMNESIAAREFFGKETSVIAKTRGQLSGARTRLAKAKRKDTETKEAFSARKDKMRDRITKLENLLEDLNASDFSDTIGAYVDQLIVDGEITHSQERQVRDILNSLFNPSGAGGLLGSLKTLTYITHLGSPLNAITQIEDLALSFYRSPAGFLPQTVRAFLNTSEIKPSDIGITTIAEELSGRGMLKKALTEILRITGFAKIDRIGKQVFINTVITKMRKQAQRPTKSFTDRLKRVFGEEHQQVVTDLKSGKMTDNIKYLAFNQLLDVQPLALTEMPEAYNRSGNLRIVYTLKTFMIRQFDFIRSEALADMRHKDTFMRGFGRLVWLTFALSLFGAGVDAIKDFIRGREFDLSDAVTDNILRRFFFSKYQISTAKRDGILRSYLEGFLPPTALFDRMVSDMIKVWDDPTKAVQSLRSLPLVGELLYQWWFVDKKKPAKKVGRK